MFASVHHLLQWIWLRIFSISLFHPYPCTLLPPVQSVAICPWALSPPYHVLFCMTWYLRWSNTSFCLSLLHLYPSTSFISSYSSMFGSLASSPSLPSWGQTCDGCAGRYWQWSTVSQRWPLVWIASCQFLWQYTRSYQGAWEEKTNFWTVPVQMTQTLWVTTLCHL